jgi:MFS family permease
MPPTPEALTRRGIPVDPQLRVLAIGSFATRFGGGAVTTTSAIYFTRHVGFSVAEVALATSIAGLASLAASLPAGHLGDTRGPREVLMWIMALAAVATPLPVLARSPLVLAILLGAEAALAASANAVRNGIIAQIAIGGRGVAFKAYLRAVTNSAIGLGSLAGGAALLVDTTAAYVAVFVGAGVLTALAAWNSTRLVHLPPHPVAAGEPRLAVLRDRPYVAVCLATSVFATHFVVAELGVALFVSQRTNAPTVIIAVMLLLNTLAVTLLQVRLSRSADSVPRGGRALVRGSLLIAAGFAFIGFAEGMPPWAAVTVLVAGALVHVAGEIVGSGGTWALQMGLAPHERQGQYQGFASLGFSLMAVFGPPLVALLCVGMGRWGWVLMGGIVVASALAAQALARWALANRTAYGVTTHSG